VYYVIAYYANCEAVVHPHTGYDDEGSPVYGTPDDPIPVRFESTLTYEREGDGLTPNSTYSLTASPDIALDIGDRVEIGESFFTVLSVKRPSDLDGTIITVATLKQEPQ
jgi:hypothetical protein